MNKINIFVLSSSGKIGNLLFDRIKNYCNHLLVVYACKQNVAGFSQRDIENMKTHHVRKMDMPSEIAKMLKCALKKTTHKNIAIHGLHLGDVVGEHEIIFATSNELIKNKHIAQNKQLFIDGCMKAIHFLNECKNIAGFYDMNSL